MILKPLLPFPQFSSTLPVQIPTVGNPRSTEVQLPFDSYGNFTRYSAGEFSDHLWTRQ